MSNRHNNSWPRCQATGLTLIEVVAAIAILGTILVGVVLSRARHTRQFALAQRKAIAVEAADALIAGWWEGPAVPVDASGVVEREGIDLAWRTREIANESIEAIGARVVRVEMREAASRAAGAEDHEAALVRVDLVLGPEPAELEANGGGADADPPAGGGP